MKMVLISVLTLTLVIVLLCSYGCGHTTGTGTRVGTIIKLSDEGWFHKTHEIEIIRGGMNAASGAFGVTPFFATISDEETYQQAQRYFDSQTEVQISYIEKWGSVWSSECSGEDEDCAFVTGIRPRQ